MAVDYDNNAKAIAGDDLPDWLREIRGDAQAAKSPASDQASASADVAAPDASESNTQEDNLPAWLQDVRGKAPPAQAAEPAEPVIEAVEPVEPAVEAIEPVEPIAEAVEPAEPVLEPIIEPSESSDDSDTDDDDDDWQRLLADEGIELDTLGEDRPEGAEDMSVRDWIAATSLDSPLAKTREAEEAAAKAQKSTEAEAEITESAPVASVEDAAPVEDDLPAWLNEDQPATSSAEASSWLTDETALDDAGAAEADTSLEEASTDGNADDELPSWLQEERSTTSEPEAASWLTDESDLDETELEEAAQVEAEVSESVDALADTPTITEDELSDVMPSWLQEERAPSTEPDVASWLTDETDLDETSDFSNLEAGESDDLEPIADTSASIDDEEDLPDWLRSGEPAEDDSGTASWLTDEASLDEAVALEDSVQDEVVASDTDIDVDAIAKEAEIAAPVSDSLDEDEDLPDWLREDSVAEVDVDAPSWLTDEATHEDDVSAVDDTEIDVFDDIANVDDILADATDVNADLDDGDIPDWLATESGSGEAAASDISPTFDVADDDATDNDGTVDEDGLPDWLRGEEASTDDLESAVGDSLPNWVADGSDSDASDGNGVPQSADVLDAFATGSQDAELSNSDDTESESSEWLDKLRESDGAEASEDEADTTIEAPALDEQPAAAIPVAEKDASTELSEDVTAKLSVAKGTLESGDLGEALTVFQDLITEAQALDEVIAILSANLEHYQNESVIYETLADAQARQGLLSQALETYQMALQKI